MTREQELRAAIAQAQLELDTLPPADRMTAREFAEAAGISATTASRIKAGREDITLTSAKAALPFLGKCPCCGQKVAQAIPDFAEVD